MKLNPNCICGGSIGRPNDDCERCQLMAEVQRLRDERDSLVIAALAAVWRMREHTGSGAARLMRELIRTLEEALPS